MNFVPKGRILDEGLKLLRSKNNELNKNLPKNFEIIMKISGKNTPYVLSISDGKTKMVFCRYKSINFEKELRHHSWKPKPQPRKKQKTEVAESSIIQKKQQYPLL